MNFSVEQVETKLNRVFDSVKGTEQCTPHTVRVVVAAWLARLNVTLPDTLEHVGWVGMHDSNEWFRYYKDGQRIYKLAMKSNVPDPVPKMLPWHDMGSNPKAIGWDPRKNWVSP